MPANRPAPMSRRVSARGLIAALLTLLLCVMARPAPIDAQAQLLGPVCSVPPDPSKADGWPVAVADSLGVVTGSATFTGAFLASNDVGTTALTVTGVTAASDRGGTIVSSGPDMYTYTPAPGVAGDDAFTYQVSDTLGQSVSGLVHVSIVADAVAPAVSITSPIGGATVFGAVTVAANASDNVGVVGVKFFDGAAQIGPEDTAAPYSTSWDTSVAANGAHSLTAVARDAAGNATTSAAVLVTVANSATVPNIVGATDAGARAAIAAANLVVGVVTSANSSTVPAGQVISQSPAAGASVARNSAVSYVLSLGAPVVAVPTVQVTVSSDGTGPRTTPAFSTTAPGEVLIALASSDGPTTGLNDQFLTISGAGLTWRRVARAAVQRGVAEIWTATAPSILANATVTSTQSVPTVLGLPANQSLTVLAFTGAAGVGASATANGITGAPRVSLVTQGAGSAVVGVGIDFDQAIPRTVPAGQTSLHEFLAPSGDTMWMQRLNGTTGLAGSTVVLNDTAPTTDQWNFAGVEITSGVPPTPVAVPNVVGSTQATAQSAITAAGLAVGAVTNSFSATVAAGVVISQSPAAGASVMPGSAVALTVSLGPAPAAPSGLVVALGFNEASGLTALDSSGNGLNGTILEATRVAGKFGGALSFDGVNDWVTVLDTTASPLDLSTSMTIEAWVNPTAMSGWETAVLKERGVGLLSYALYAHDGAPFAGGVAAPAGYIRAGGVDQPVRGTGPLALGTWTHIATTYDGANQRFYVNGVLVATRAQTGLIAVGNGALRIGGNASFTDEFFEGLIDEVRVYNRALSAAEITRDMNTPVQ